MLKNILFISFYLSPIFGASSSTNVLTSKKTPYKSIGYMLDRKEINANFLTFEQYDLNNKDITDLNGIQNVNYITHLSATNNHITEIKARRLSTNLELLNLANNKISYIESGALSQKLKGLFYQTIK